MSANLFVDWQAEFHTPGYQASNDLPVPAGSITVQGLLNEAAGKCNPSITYTANGSGGSAYLTGIDGVVSNHLGNGFYWVYYVNGVMPSVGFGAFVIKDGDSVVWDYKHYSSGLVQHNQPPHSEPPWADED